MPSALLKQGAVYRSPVLDAFEWLEHGFGTRNTDGWPDRSRLVFLRQIHSDVVQIADRDCGCVGEGDALATDRPGLLLAVKTADCLPILLADEKRRVVAAIHAGWRGTARGIARRTVETLRRNFSCRPEDLWVAIGPGISRCCYEVGPEVAEKFRRLLPELERVQGSVRLELAEANRRELVAAGVAVERIWTAGLCTCCRPEEFHSHRREPSLRGRMWSVIGIRTP
jgi:YfiH family protein